MTVVYFDSSALVKLVVEEEQREVAVRVWDGCSAAVSSRLAYPEVRAAMAAMHRARRVSRSTLGRAERLWDELWAHVSAVELTRQIADRAGSLAARHALSGADAVHLASVESLPPSTVFAGWDQRLSAGAAALGRVVVPERDQL
ncbi:MAG: type II toxin-antitoxin system VapC family toxin [Angustibacter sp.]